MAFDKGVLDIIDGNFTVYQVIKFKGVSVRDGIETLAFNSSGFGCTAFKANGSAN